MPRSAPIRTRLVLAIYLLAFAGAALNHARDFARAGPRPYRMVPLPLEIFWSSLILLDLGVVALLLAGWRRAGLALAAAIIVSDVGVNGTAALATPYAGFGVPLLLQTAFLGFVLGTAPFVWPDRPGPIGG